MKLSVFAFLLALLLAGAAPAADSLNVRLIGYCNTSNMAHGVDVGGDYACVADYYAGLRVISVADPTSPSEVGHYDNPGISTRVAIIDTVYVYLPDSGSGAHIISIADPAHPAEVGFLDTPGHVGGIAVVGRYAYVADGGALLVVSIADPANPVIVASCDTSGAVNDVAVSGDYAYAIDLNLGLQVISVVDPAHPVEVGHCDMTGAWNVAVSGSYVCAGGFGGLSVISVADPANPTKVGSYGTVNALNDVTMDGDVAYAAVGAFGLRIVSIEDPAHPLEVGHYHGIGQAYGVTLAGGYIFLADGSIGLLVLQHYGSGVEESYKAQASDRGPAATVIRNLPAGSAAFDAMGRRVLDPKPGLYFVRERSAVGGQPSAVAVRKVVITK